MNTDSGEPQRINSTLSLYSLVFDPTVETRWWINDHLHLKMLNISQTIISCNSHTASIPPVTFYRTFMSFILTGEGQSCDKVQE